MQNEKISEIRRLISQMEDAVNFNQIESMSNDDIKAATTEELFVRAEILNKNQRELNNLIQDRLASIIALASELEKEKGGKRE